MRALLSQFSVSQINRIGYQFLTVTVLRAQQFIQKCRPPLGFLIKITGTAIGEELILINLLSRCLFRYFYSIQSLFWDILYRGLNLGYFPSLIIILWLYSQCSASLSASFCKNVIRCLQYSSGTFTAGLVCLFNTKALLISAIITVKIVYLGFLASCTSRVAPIIQIFRVLGLFRSSIVFCVVSYLNLDLVKSKKSVLDLGLGSLSIFFIVKYQSFWYSHVVNLSFCLA